MAVLYGYLRYPNSISVAATNLDAFTHTAVIIQIYYTFTLWNNLSWWKPYKAILRWRMHLSASHFTKTNADIFYVSIANTRDENTPDAPGGGAGPRGDRGIAPAPVLPPSAGWGREQVLQGRPEVTFNPVSWTGCDL